VTAPPGRAWNLAWQEALNVPNLALVARLTAEAALYRTESRGSHFRRDFPARDDERWLVNVHQRMAGGEQLSDAARSLFPPPAGAPNSDAVNWFRKVPHAPHKRAITLHIRRFSPGAEPYWQAYAVPVTPKMSVLDALFDVLEQQDPTLSFRYSCRAQMCGSCAMRVNGRETLACGRRLEELEDAVTVEPLRNLPVMKDLVVDMAPFFAGYGAVDPAFAGATGA